ncbi:MAG: YggT family protein [Brevinematia bacterium]
MFEFTSFLKVPLYIIANFIRIYEFILFVRVIFSWIGMFNPNLYTSKIFLIVYQITEPPLSFIRNNLPSRIGFFDLSVLWLFIMLEVLYLVIMKLNSTII